MNARINVHTPEVWESSGFPMSQAVVEPDGRRVHLTGQVAWDTDLNVLHPNDAGAQTRVALGNIARVLDSISGGLEDIVSLTTYYVRSEDKGAITAARAEAFREEFGPASTGIRVAGLWDDDLLVELAAIAVIPHARFRGPRP